MVRQIDNATLAALDQSVLYPVVFVRIDIKDDPIYVWSGLYEKTISGTGDAQIDGFTFEVGGHLAEFSAITDSAEGSQPLTISMSGVDPTMPMLKQIVWDSRAWQFRQAWIWLGLLDFSGQLVGKPIRLKTGRVDKLTYEESGGQAKLSISIESHQAWAGTSLNSKWANQNQIDSSDISQNFTAKLANIQPTLGGSGSGVPTTPTNGSLTSSGSRYTDGNANAQVY